MRENMQIGVVIQRRIRMWNLCFTYACLYGLIFS